MLILAQENILEMIDMKILDLEDLIATPTEVLRDLFYNEEVIEMLQNEDISFGDLLNLHRIAQEQGEDFSEALQEFISAVEKGEYSVLDILKLYEEDALHLLFMKGEPDEIVLENSDNEAIVKFGIEHYDIDIDWIRCELGGDGDTDSAALMDFDRIIGTHEEPDGSDSGYNSYDEFSEEHDINNVQVDKIIQKYNPGIINSSELTGFITHKGDRTYLSKRLIEAKKLYNILDILSEKLNSICGDNTKVKSLIDLGLKLMGEDETIANARFEEVYDALSDIEKALYEEHNDIEYALKAISSVVSTLNDIQASMPSEDDNGLSTMLNSLNLTELNPINQLSLLGLLQSESQSDSE